MASRGLSTLPENRFIYVHSTANAAQEHVLTLLPTEPCTAALAIGNSPTEVPSPSTFRTNPGFLRVLQSVIRAHAVHDPDVQQQAAVFASPGGYNLGGLSIAGGAGGASHQSGMGGANRGGWMHISDMRHPPDWGRIPDPEDIFGSVEVDGNGKLVGDDANYQENGTYRVVTLNGVLGIPPFLRKKLLERLQELENAAQKTKASDQDGAQRTLDTTSSPAITCEQLPAPTDHVAEPQKRI